MRDGEICLHLTGTRFFEPIDDERLERPATCGSRRWSSENREVYRAEYLAYLMYGEVETGNLPADEFLAAEPPQRAGHASSSSWAPLRRGYVKGVHDHDAALILGALLEMRQHASGCCVSIRRPGPWAGSSGTVCRPESEGAHGGQAERLRPDPRAVSRLRRAAALRRPKLAAMLAVRSRRQTGLFAAELVDEAAEYLFYELICGRRLRRQPHGGRPVRGVSDDLKQKGCGREVDRPR